jgi:glycosyltransferase involved in cell wall biosynthesis
MDNYLKKDLTIAVPCYNEERNISKSIENIKSVLQNFPNINYEIIIINDGSTDSTDEIARSLINEQNIRLINNEKNSGLGYSIKKAIENAIGKYFIILPGDNDLPMGSIEKLLSNFGKSDIIMMYFQNNEIRGRTRYLLSSIFKCIYVTTFNIYVMYLNGPALYRSEKLKKLKLRSNRFSIVAEINIKLLRMGSTYLEVPCSRLNNMDSSKSFSIKNIMEATKIYLATLWDVYGKNRNKYKNKPLRIDY